MSSELPSGFLDITIVSASDFPSNLPRHSFFQANPDVQVVVMYGDEVMFKTPVKRATVKPKWNHVGKVLINNTHKISLLVFDYFKGEKNRLLGSTSFDPRRIARGERQEKFRIQRRDTDGSLVFVCALLVTLCPDPATLIDPDEPPQSARFTEPSTKIVDSVKTPKGTSPSSKSGSRGFPAAASSSSSSSQKKDKGKKAARKGDDDDGDDDKKSKDDADNKDSDDGGDDNSDGDGDNDDDNDDDDDDDDEEVVYIEDDSDGDDDREPGKLERGFSTFSAFSDDVVYCSDSDGAGGIVEESDEDQRVDDITFRVMASEDIAESQLADIRTIKDLFDIPAYTARQLLQANKWNAKDLAIRFYESDAAEIFKKARILDPRSDAAKQEMAGLVTKDPEEEVLCTVCFCDYPRKETTCMPCGHFLCDGCWGNYLRVQVEELGMSTSIKCPGKDCYYLVDEVTVCRLIADRPDTTKKYKRMIALEWVKAKPNAKWCPGVGCENAIEVELCKACPVTCTCKTQWCFKCQAQPHNPASCEQFAEWEKKTNSKDTAAALMLLCNIKPCPNCKVMIEKNEGCQYINCTSCHKTFCWLCMQFFDHQKHACNTYKDSPEANQAKNELNKWDWFSRRAAAHVQSDKMEEDRLVRMRLRIQESQESVSKYDFLEKAAATLHEARKLLYATYVFGYFIPKDVNRDLFEFLQAELESATENLSGVMNKNPEAQVRSEVMTLQANVATRGRNLIQGLESDDLTSTFKQKEKIYDGPVTTGYSGWVYDG